MGYGEPILMCLPGVSLSRRLTEAVELGPIVVPGCIIGSICSSRENSSVFSESISSMIVTFTHCLLTECGEEVLSVNITCCAVSPL